MDVQDNQLTEDVREALRTYLGASKHLTDDKLAQQLTERIKKMEQAASGKHGVPLEEVSLAIKACPASEKFAQHLERLRNLLVVARTRETSLICPGLHIEFEDLTWDQYYGGKTNIKYPDVRKMAPFLCKDNIVQKMMLFDLLQADRQKCCQFPDKIILPKGFEDRHTTCPAILIPSGGKHGKWLGEALGDEENFWWVRCRSFAHVIFLVSDEELDNYQPFTAKGVTVVSYVGFGMGCGRAAGISIAKMLNRVCIMTDDRTKDLTYWKTSVTEVHLKGMIGPADDNEFYCGGRPFLSGVTPKGELNILTIINPQTAQARKPTFSKYFISSKEDKGLYLYCKALQLIGDSPEIGETHEPFQVHFDANNPPYQNTQSNFSGRKGEAIACITASKLYCSLTTHKPIDWKHLSGPGKFKNQWDALKMQDSAMFLLLQQIVGEMVGMGEGNVPPELWEAFHKYIGAWFS